MPGKNLMNLAITLLMSAIFWIISSLTNPVEHPTFCVALIIVQHYFFIASFTSMSVIPNAISLLFNIVMFLSAAVQFRKHSQVNMVARESWSAKRLFFAI